MIRFIETLYYILTRRVCLTDVTKSFYTSSVFMGYHVNYLYRNINISFKWNFRNREIKKVHGYVLVIPLHPMNRSSNSFGLGAKAATYADDITVFVSRKSDIKAVKNAVEKYEEVSRCQDQLWLERGSTVGCLERSWPPTGILPLEWRARPHPRSVVRARPPTGTDLIGVRAKVEAHMGTWLRMCLSLKGRAEVRAVYIFPWVLYRLSVLLLPGSHWLALTQPLSKLLWSGRRPMVRRRVCYQHPRNGGLGMPNLESHWLAERLAYLGRSLSRDMVWGRLSSPEVRFSSA